MEKITMGDMLNKHFPTKKCLKCPAYSKSLNICAVAQTEYKDSNMMEICLEKQIEIITNNNFN